MQNSIKDVQKKLQTIQAKNRLVPRVVRIFLLFRVAFILGNPVLYWAVKNFGS
jgi:hypothetical protein